MTRALLALALAACAGSPAAPTSEPGPRRFELPGHGALWLDLPRGWTARTGDAGPSLAPMIEVAPPSRAFVLRMTPVWRPGEGDAPADADSAQLLAELARRSAVPRSVEGEDLELRELSGARVRGFWFEATDREAAGATPGAAARGRLVQGAAAVGPILVAFSLVGDAPARERDAALGIVAGARHAVDREPPPVPGAAEALEPDPGAETVPLSAGVPGRSWTALVDLPGFRMFRPGPLEGGRGVRVVGEDRERGLVASLILSEGGPETRPAFAPGPDAAACREEALTKIEKALPDLADLTRSAAGPAARASYVSTGRDGPAAHAHAFLARDGVCVNLHVSRSELGPEGAARVEAILASLRFADAL